MLEEKESPKLGGWFSDINRLLLILVAGTVLVSEVPFHDFRPSKSAGAAPVYSEADARLWQDPLEAVTRHLEQNGDHTRGDSQFILGDSLRNKLGDPAEGLHFQTLNVLAVMLPGGPYFEQSETRRRLRYAVLSGFDAARRYMPEDPEHLNYVELCRGGMNAAGVHEGGGIDALCTGKSLGPVVYEWLVYKPAEHSTQAGGSADPSARGRFAYAPILLVYLKNDYFRVAPVHKLKQLFATLRAAFGARPDCEPADRPESAPAQLPKGPLIPLGPAPGCDAGQDTGHGGVDWNVSVLGPYDSDTLQDMVMELSADPAAERPAKAQDGVRLRFYSPSASLQDSRLLQAASGDFVDLEAFFKRHELPFIRVLSSDQKLAEAARDELALRGVVPGPGSRVLLLGEWDTLYGWHLPGTFADALLNGAGAKCPAHRDSPDGFPRQNHEDVYPDDLQCVFQFSYLRGLDGEKAWLRERSDKDGKDQGKADSEAERGRRLEDADGDSQFDYIRRLATKVADLDQRIRDLGGIRAAHPIKAIGVLGSDVYDKLLVLEAMHERFPDAVFFTNGMDARFLHPDKNKWARNLVMISAFGLELDRPLQRDIPPFRDSAQTAFFLATEMALSKVQVEGAPAGTEPGDDGSIARPKGNPPCPDGWCIGATWKARLSQDSQKDLNRLIGHPRLHEVGRTRTFPLEPEPSTGKAASPEAEGSLHPPITTPSVSVGIAILGGGLMLTALLTFRESRRFLAGSTGLLYVLLTAVIILAVSFYACRPDLLQDSNPAFSLRVLGATYLATMLLILLRDDRCCLKTAVDDPAWCLPASLAVLLAAYGGLWFALIPGADRLDGGEIYAFLEGVSMWPTEGIRLLALILAGYFIIEVYRFPNRFTVWMEQHFGLPGLGESRTRSESSGHVLVKYLPWVTRWQGSRAKIRDCLFGPRIPEAPNPSLAEQLPRCVPLNDWLAWRNAPRRLVVGVLLAVGFYVLGTALFMSFGAPRSPIRGETIALLDTYLMRGFLVPAFALLLMLVVDAVWVAVRLVERAFPEEGGGVRWPAETCRLYGSTFQLDPHEMAPWIGMRFVEELTRRIYGIIGYPLIIALLLVLSRSNFIDCFIMPVAFKLIIVFSLVLLFGSDYWLKKAADMARKKALKRLRERVTQCKGDATGEQLERLVGMIEQADEVVYRSFTQRPIFRGSLLLVAALLADFADYSTLASRLF